MHTEERTCDECGESTRHAITDETAHCLGCGVAVTGESRTDCAIAYCPVSATHLLVLAADRSDRHHHQYCESHIRVATDDARADPARDVVGGPLELEFES